MKNSFSLLLLFVFQVSHTQNLPDTAAMDRSIRPGDDFYLFANGTWIKHTILPPSQPVYSNATIAAEKVNTALFSILDEAVRKPSNPKSKMLGDFYRSAMDTARLNRLGATPIKKDIKRIENIPSASGILEEGIYQKVNGLAAPFFNLSVATDKKNAARAIFQLGQGGISLPDRDFYVLKQYGPLTGLLRDYMARLFQVYGDD